MKKYKALKGESGVTHYEITANSIAVAFNDAVYVYSYNKPGREHVEQMKLLAEKGRGLSTYISRYVKKDYDITYFLKQKP